MPFKGSIYDNQTDILRWLESRGHRVDYGPDHVAMSGGRQKRRSCEVKARFENEPPPMPGAVPYRCGFCGRWHRATARQANG